MKIFNEFVLSLETAEPQQFSGLTIVPLLARGVSRREFLLLDEALRGGAFHISEASEVGVVAKLHVTNLTGRPVLLVEGEELIGAKQNRVLNLSLLVPPGDTRDIPVSCVEAGRWSWRSEEFHASANTQFAEGRARKVAQVSEALFQRSVATSDQSDVWETIRRKAERLNAESETGAMSAMFERIQAPIRRYAESLPCIEGQVGGVFLIAGAVVGLDAFASADAYASLHTKIVAGYAADAFEVGGPMHYDSKRKAAEFVDLVGAAETEAYEVAGLGRTVRLRSADIAGAALEYGGEVLHLAAFSGQSRRGARRG